MNYNVLIKTPMIEITLAILVVVFVVGLCVRNHNLNKVIHDIGDSDAEQVRKSAEHSIMASNTVNPILALVEISRSVQILDSLHFRHGPHKASELTGIDTSQMRTVLKSQEDSIMQDIMSTHPHLLPNHPLVEHAGMILPAE